MILSKTRILPILFLAGSFFFLSCVGTYTVKNTRTAPLDADFYLKLSDLEYLGEMEISVSYSKYLGIFKVDRLINGQEVSRRTVNYVNLYGFSDLPLNPIFKRGFRPSMIDRALYDAHIKFPDAEFLIPINIIEETEKMFLGRNVRKTATIKAFKMKL